MTDAKKTYGPYAGKMIGCRVSDERYEALKTICKQRSTESEKVKMSDLIRTALEEKFFAKV